MNQYSYDGPVMEFGTLVAEHWKGTTYAVSESKARSNLTYQFKKQNNRLAGSKISLPGKVVMVGRKEQTNGRLQAKFS